MSNPSLDHATKSTGRGRWYAALVFLIVLTEQTGLGFLLVTPGLPQFAAKYETTQIGWALTIFTLVGAIVTPVVGKLGDRYGKKKVLLITAAVAFAGSVVSALAPTWTALLIGRALSGASIAFLPVTIALVRDVFPNHMRSIGIALTSNGIGAVAIIGPFIAGLLINGFGVSSVFWFLALIGLVGALGTTALIPETRVRNRAPVDILGAGWLALGLLLLMLGISEVQSWGWTDWRTFVTIGGGVVLLVGWWFFESRVDKPFIDIALLSSRPILTVILVYALTQAAGTVTASYLPTMLQTPRELTGGTYGFGIDVTTVGLFLAPYAVLIILMGFLVGSLQRRTGSWLFIVAGPLFSLAGALVIAFLRAEAWMPIVGYSLFGLQAMAWAAASYQLMASSPIAVRAVTASMMGAISGALSAVFTQVAGASLSAFGASFVEGVAVFTSTGMTSVFLISAALSIAAFLIGLLVPKRIPTPNDGDEDLVVVDGGTENPAATSSRPAVLGH